MSETPDHGAQSSENSDGTEAPLDFDPYRFGAPEHPIPPEYAPPGYKPPAPTRPPPGVPPPLPQSGYLPPAYRPGPPPPPQQVPYGMPYYAHQRRGTAKAITSM